MTMINILETSVGKGIDFKSKMHITVKFLITNKDSILINPVDKERLIKSASNPTSSPISDLFDMMSMQDKLGMFQFLSLGSVNKIPPNFLISWLDLDVLQLKKVDPKSYKSLVMMPDYNDKILLDITPFISKDGSRIVDTGTFQARILRDALCRSYEQAGDLWLSPNLIYILAKFYSIIISNKLGRVYQLTYPEQMTIAGVLAIYFINKCSSDDNPISPLISKLDFVSRIVDMKAISSVVDDYYKKNKSFEIYDAINVINEMSPTRMHNFSKATFFSMLMNISSDQLMSMISMEYPPYWCYHILDALSGSKTNLFHTIKATGLKNDATKFAMEIVKTQTFSKSLA